MKLRSVQLLPSENCRIFCAASTIDFNFGGYFSAMISVAHGVLGRRGRQKIDLAVILGKFNANQLIFELDIVPSGGICFRAIGIKFANGSH
jgi:hypothetical protein